MFESQAHHLRVYYQTILYYTCHFCWENDENKQKEDGFSPYYFLKKPSWWIKWMFLKGHSRPLFVYFRSFSNKFYNKFMWKMSTQYPVLGSNLQPSIYESPPLTTRPPMRPIDRWSVVFYSATTPTGSVWPGWTIYWALGNFLKRWQQLICPNLPHSLAIFVKVSKSIIFLVKSFLGNIDRHLAIFSGLTEQD